MTNKPWLTLDQFTENARSAGDIAILRRGTTAQYDDGTDLGFTSDGAFNNPIVIEADFFGSSANGLHASDDWNGGDQFANSTQTYTMVFGSKTHTASATISGISVGDWIFNTTDGDDAKEFSYEVAAVSGTTLTLKLPYKGSTGATKTLKVMPANPVWGALTTAFQVSIDADNYWKIQGEEFTGSDINGTIEVDTSFGIEFLDCNFKPDTLDTGMEFRFDTSVNLKKCRFDGGSRATTFGIRPNSSFNSLTFDASDCLFEDLTVGIESEILSLVRLIDCEGNGNSQADISRNASPSFFGCKFFLRNFTFGTGTFEVENNQFYGVRIISEDHDNVLNVTKQFLGVGIEDTAILESDTGTVRSGGSNISIKITPQVNVGDKFYSRIKLFEIAFYAATSSKTYDIYFKSNATANWTADPLVTELFIELEAWGHASNNSRKITKSTGVLDFNGVTTWNKLSVTVAPAQAGVAYLRGWYMKPKESAKSNEFFIDPKPVVT